MRRYHAVRLVGAVVLAVGELGCSGEGGSEPPTLVPTTVAGSGDTQTGTAGSRLPAAIAVTILDQNGDGLPGVAVTFVVTGGGGIVDPPTAVSDARGTASTAWTLGPSAGTNNNVVSARVTGYSGPSTEFTASAIAGRPTELTKSAGDNQTGEVARTLPLSPTVTVRDQFDNPVTGVPVTWTVIGGGGSVVDNTSTTDAAGEAPASWAIGPQVGSGVHTLHASIPGEAPAVLFTATGAMTAGTLSIVSGDDQMAVVNKTLGAPLFVLARTPGVAGVPVSGVTVAWDVVAGGGGLQWPVSVTNGAGLAIDFWTVGGTPGIRNQSVAASVAGLDGSPVTFVATATPIPYQLTLVSGNLQTAQAGSALPERFVVLVRDSLNTPVQGVLVFWQAIAGGGMLPTNASYTNAAGEAWMLFTVGITAGVNNQAIIASVPNLVGSPVTFTASVVAAAPAQMARFSGDGQAATVGTALTQPIAVIVRDLWGNVKSGVTVNWAASAGSGMTSVSTSITDAAGIASTGWTLGTVAGINNQVATASSGSLAGSPLTFTASALPSANPVLAGMLEIDR